MFDVSTSNELFLTKGNSALIDITPINEETGDPIILEDGDKIVFTVKSMNGVLKLQKILTKDNYTDEDDTSVNCTIEPSDTVDWGIGTYCYDCLLCTNDGEAITFISSTLKLLKALGKYTDVR